VAEKKNRAPKPAPTKYVWVAEQWARDVRDRAFVLNRQKLLRAEVTLGL